MTQSCRKSRKGKWLDQSITDTFLYDMWGKELATTGSINFLRHRWIGELGYYLDKDLAEYNIRARAYDPTYGHFLSRDPLGLSQGWNLYRYANTQPTVLVDPSGMQLILHIAPAIPRTTAVPEMCPIPRIGLMPSTPVIPPLLPTEPKAQSPKTEPQPEPGPPIVPPWIPKHVPRGPRRPPGNCSQKERDRLQDAVKFYCSWGGCHFWTSCEDTLKNIRMVRECIKWRDEINKRCYNGGDAGHKQQVIDTINKHRNCIMHALDHDCYGPITMT